MAPLRSIFRSWRTDAGPVSSRVATDETPTSAVPAESRSWAAEPPPAPIEDTPEPVIVQQIEMSPQGARRVTWVCTVSTPGGGQLEFRPQELLLAVDQIWPSEPAANLDRLN